MQVWLRYKGNKGIVDFEGFYAQLNLGTIDGEISSQ